MVSCCESWIQQNNEQRDKYLCRLEHDETLGLFVMMMRKPDETVSYCRECRGNIVCAACAPNSPITRFKRVRHMYFIPLFPNDPNTEYEVRCDCPFQPVVGVPCHHFSLFLDILPRHVHIRYHKSLDVLWRREGFEDRMDGFRHRLQQHKLIITADEYQTIILAARANSSPITVFPFAKSIPVQMNKRGIIVSEDLSNMRAAEAQRHYLRDDTYNQGDLVEVLRKPKGVEDEEDWPASQTPTQPMEGVGVDLQSRLGQMMTQLVERHEGDPVSTAVLVEQVENLFCTLMAKVDSGSYHAAPVTPSPTKKKVQGKRKGAVGMVSVGYLTGNTCIRIKSSCEGKRPMKKKSRKTSLANSVIR